MPSRPQDEAMAELYRNDPMLAVQLLNDVLTDGDRQALLVTLRQMALAFGGRRSVTTATEMSPTQLDRILSGGGAPTLSTLIAVLKTVGLRLAVQPIKRRKSTRARS